jgi:hypothetical protein
MLPLPPQARGLQAQQAQSVAPARFMSPHQDADSFRLSSCRAKGRAKLEAQKGGKSQLGSRAQALKVKCPKCFTPMSDYVREMPYSSDDALAYVRRASREPAADGFASPRRLRRFTATASFARPPRPHSDPPSSLTRAFSPSTSSQ